MWGSKNKKNKALKKWHDKAMMVDFRKTEITMIWASTPKEFAVEEKLDKADMNNESAESNVIEVPKKFAVEEKLEAMDPNFENTAIEMVKTQNTNENAENLEAFEPILQNTVSNMAESISFFEPTEDREAIEQDLSTIESTFNEASNTIATEENLSTVEPNGIEDANTHEIMECNYESLPVEKETLNVKFLRVLKKTGSEWDDDKQLTKIIRKMEKGKNLKRKEFDKVFMHVRTYCQYY